ncbi:hypothetical protein B5807_00765 [Epicoccum nigrum]|uniref:Uncharacterized protein n=1 Tax=Epicoccum nigrum TaxID=105696 RepID=A0A1Y2MEG2_EPING|nr:hypothetical protein B5807_00765 [Epicoccum nigrum]
MRQARQQLPISELTLYEHFRQYLPRFKYCDWSPHTQGEIWHLSLTVEAISIAEDPLKVYYSNMKTCSIHTPALKIEVRNKSSTLQNRHRSSLGIRPNTCLFCPKRTPKKTPPPADEQNAH